jgi:3-hydroxyisobutyrate dehydrogenase
MGDIEKTTSVGWIGAGRMGYALIERLLDAGYDVSVYNRTRSKAEPLAERGAKSYSSWSLPPTTSRT